MVIGISNKNNKSPQILPSRCAVGGVLICLFGLALVCFRPYYTPASDWKRVINNCRLSGMADFCRLPVNRPRGHPELSVVKFLTGSRLAVRDADGNPHAMHLGNLDKWNHNASRPLQRSVWTVREQHCSLTFGVPVGQPASIFHHCAHRRGGRQSVRSLFRSLPFRREKLANCQHS